MKNRREEGGSGNPGPSSIIVKEVRVKLLFAVEVEKYGVGYKARPIYKMGRGRSVRDYTSEILGTSVSDAVRKLCEGLVARGDLKQ